MPIWPYYNPAEMHTQDVTAFSAFEQSNQARAETTMRREKLRREAEDEAIRQQGVMEYQQLVQTGVTPAEAIRITGGKIFRGRDWELPQEIRMSTPRPESPDYFTLGNKRYERLPGKEATVIAEGPSSSDRRVPAFTDQEQDQLTVLEQKQTDFNAGQKPPIPASVWDWNGTTFPAPVPLTDSETARLNQLREEKKRWLERYGPQPSTGPSVPVVPPTVKPLPDKAKARAEAQAKIAAGKDPNWIRAKFRATYGEDL